MPRLDRAGVITAKQLYIAGKPLTEIARQLNCNYASIAKRAKRNNWQADADKAMSKVDKMVAADVQKQQLAIVRAIASRQFAWKERVLALAERHIGQVEARSMDGISLDDLEKLVRIADKTDLIGRRQLGMDIENQHNSLHIHTGEAGKTAPLQLTEEPGNIVDVEEDATGQ